MLWGRELLDQGKGKAVFPLANRLQSQASSLASAYYVKPTPPLVEREASEIMKMAMALRDAAQKERDIKASSAPMRKESST